MRSRWLGFALIGLAVIFSLWAYPQLPERVATHWNVRGEPDGYSSRLLAIWLMPAVMLALRGVMQVLPLIDPRRANYAKFLDTYWLFVNGIVLLMGLLHAVMLGSALGWPMPVGRIVPIAVGVLFMVLGNYLSRVQPNWFVGIRTPWTLSSDEVWRKTHRTGGWLFVLAGVMVVVIAFIPGAAVIPLFAAAIVIAAVIPIVQSYVLWRREQTRAR